MRARVHRRAASQPRSWMMKSLAGWKTADQCVSVFTLETFLSLTRHPVVMLFSPFVRKHPNSKASSPLLASRRPAVSRATRFSAPELSTHAVYVYTFVLIGGRCYDCNRAFLQEPFGTDGATPSESPFMTPGERLDREQDEPDSHKAKKPVIKIPKKLKAKVTPACASCGCY